MEFLRTKEALLFDLDGTLVDSAPDLAVVVNHTLRHVNYPPCSEKQIRLWIGNGPETLVHRALCGQLEGVADPELHKKAMPIFFAHYQQQCTALSGLYAGVKEGLFAFKQAGYQLACVTNKYQRFTKPLLQRLEIAQLFSVVVSGDSLPSKKPQPEPLWFACEQMAVNPAQAVMFGDSITDITAAKNAAMEVVAVSYGYNHGRPIADGNPSAVIDSFNDCIPYLRSVI